MQKDGAKLKGQDALFLSLVEELTRPFLQITRMSELALADTAQATDLVHSMQAVADASLQIVESYALSLRVHGHITPLHLEPITISSLLYDTAEGLRPFARQYGVELELDTGPRQHPIIADRAVLQAAMTSLGQVFVLAEAEADESCPVRLSAHKSRYGVVAGLYGPQTLGADSLRRARALHGQARQPLHNLVSGPAAGVFVADSLLQTLASKLHVARYRNLTGLAATLTPSQHLQLV